MMFLKRNKNLHSVFNILIYIFLRKIINFLLKNQLTLKINQCDVKTA